MKSKLLVNNNGVIIFDGKIIEKKDLSSAFLSDLFTRSSKEEIEYEIDNTDPISILFKKIEEETKIDSDYNRKRKELKNKYVEADTNQKLFEEKLKSIE